MSGQNSRKTETLDRVVTDDWLEQLPITDAELELFEVHMLDIITAMIQHS